MFHQKVELDAQRHHRFRLLTCLISELGRGVGNLVAQQYGVGSEAIDVTTDPTFAAFFATRKYPAYEHFAGSTKNQVGIIYRFPKVGSIRDLSQLEEKLDRLGHGAPVGSWFDQVVRRSTAPPEVIERVEGVLNRHGREQLVLFTPPIIVDYADFSQCLLEALATRFRFSPSNMEQTRVARQRGGFIRPPVHWLCTVPADRVLDTAYLKPYRAYSPGIAIGEKVTAIEDTMAFPGLELFFFRHSARPIEGVARDHLWPPSRTDELYNYLNDLCLDDREISEHLEESDIWLEHPKGGVIDRGFYTGAESIAWAARVALRDGDPERAMQLIDDAMAIDSGNSDYHVQRAQVAVEQGRLEQALSDFDAALCLDPDNWHATMNRADVLVQQKNVDAAIAGLTGAIANHPQRSELYLVRANAYGLVSRSDLTVADCDEGLKHVGIGVANIGTRLHFLQLKVLALTALGKDAEADATLNRIPPEWVDVARLRAHIQKMRAERTIVKR
jgi:hypothetical protein